MKATMISRHDCSARDLDDPLAPLRQQFDLPQGVIYLDGNSLGARPTAALARAQHVITAEWGTDLIRSWNTAGWFDLPKRLGDHLAPLLGAATGEVVITDSTSVNLFKPGRRPADAGKRPARRAAHHRHRTQQLPHRRIWRKAWPPGWTRLPLRLVDSPAELAEAIDADTAVAMLTHVHYRSGPARHGRRHRPGPRKGALALWDLSHTAGALALRSQRRRRRPGRRLRLQVPERRPRRAGLRVRRQPPPGRDPLAAVRLDGPCRALRLRGPLPPAADIRSLLCGTPPILALAALEVGLDLQLEAGAAAIEAKGLALCDLFIRAGRGPLRRPRPGPVRSAGA